MFLFLGVNAQGQVVVNSDGTHSIQHGPHIINPNGTISVKHGPVITNVTGSPSTVHGISENGTKAPDNNSLELLSNQQRRKQQKKKQFYFRSRMVGAASRLDAELADLDSIERANNENVMASGDNITKAFVSLEDGDNTINLIANIKKDHRIIGYAEPNITSERLILLSVFTSDVENNPFRCRLGAYYDTSRMDDMTLKYIETKGNYVKASAIDKNNNSTIIYFEKKWVEFE